jgi:hypothetical protein
VNDSNWNTVITGIFGILGTIIGGWLAVQVAKVHTIVNQQRTDMIAEIRQLRQEKADKAEVARALAERAGPPDH